MQGNVTTAASKVLSSEAPAVQDAPFFAQLQHAGTIIVGRTNMTEFAYSGLGINKHFGTPLSPIGKGLIAGGSTSGSAISVEQGMSLLAVGSDTSLTMEYKHHLEAGYCISGEGEITNHSDGKTQLIKPFTIYALDQNDRHTFHATKGEVRLVRVFNPPVTWAEVHPEDGSYAPAN